MSGLVLLVYAGNNVLSISYTFIPNSSVKLLLMPSHRVNMCGLLDQTTQDLQSVPAETI
jgi:hypothetical protein